MEEAAWSCSWKMVNLDKYPRSQLSLEETQTEPVPLCKWKASEQSQPCSGPPPIPQRGLVPSLPSFFHQEDTQQALLRWHG